MNILLVAYYFPPIISGGSQRPVRMAKHLEKLGNRVTILAPAYEKVNPAEKNVIRILDPSHSMKRRGIHGLQWLRLRIPVEMLNCTGRYSSIYSNWRENVLRHDDEILRLAQPEIIMATYPPVETLEIGLHLSRKYQLPLMSDFRDGLLFEPIESKRLRRFACIRNKYTDIEHQVAAAASALITVSEPLSDYFRRTYRHERVITVANDFDPEENVMPLPEVTLEPGCFHIVHTGRFALSDVGCDISPLVQALRGLLAVKPELGRTLRLHLLGKLNRRERRLLAGLSRCGMVRMHGSVDRLQALAFQRRADLLLLVTSPERSSVATTKLFEYLQARRPVLALTEKSFAAEIVEKTRCGWIIPPQSTEKIQKTLERLISDPGRERETDMSPAAISKYSTSAAFAPLSALLRNLSLRYGSGRADGAESDY